MAGRDFRHIARRRGIVFSHQSYAGKREDTVGHYSIRGIELYNRQNKVVALARGNSLYDVNDRRVATVRGNDLYDSDDRKMMSLRGADVYDAGDMKIGSLAEVRKSIDGPLASMLLVALWFCFVR
jgi:hypothetical protein